MFHCALSLCKNPFMALSYIQEKHEEMGVSARVCVQLSTGKMYWYNVLQFIYHCMKEITSWRLTEFTSLLIRCLRPAAEFPLIFTPAPSLFPLLLLASSYSAVMEGHRWSDHTLHVREPVNCHYSWIDCSENQASGLHVHQKEDRKIPEELISKLSVALAEIRTERFPKCFPGKLQGTCVFVSA